MPPAGADPVPLVARVPRPEVFQTNGLSEDAQVEAWERHNACALVALSCRPIDGHGFDAQEINLQLDEIHLARVRATRHVVERPASLVKEIPARSIAVYASLRGEAILEYAGRRKVIRPGQLIVCDVDAPFLRGFGHGLEELAVKVPVDAFEARTGIASMPSPLVLDAGRDQDPHGRALVQMVGRALRPHDPVPADEDAVLDLISVIATAGKVSLATAHRAAAKAFIEDHLVDPGLSATTVAAGAGISERHLSRLFADAGTSVPRHILGRRLELAYAMLASASDPTVRTVDVAERCGFTSASYFSQAFRKRFGVAAGDVRRAARA
ncbi:helix-turn-helix domain-containing protein [Nocardioides sp. NPDC051685]|uniref:helix-turn-helix domain-containing protein n=1 Tax=Nocardioides sp. NPDC051685 TaxID=3364334 RepID=UPI00378743EC